MWQPVARRGRMWGVITRGVNTQIRVIIVVSCREKFNRVQLRQVRRDMEHDNHRSITTDPGHAERSAGRAHACT